LNLNQVMLAEEVREGKGADASLPVNAFITCPSKKDTTMSSQIRLALVAIAGLSTLPVFAQSALAEDKPNLAIYVYDGFASEWGPGPKLKEGFEATCDCTLEWIGTETSIGALRRAQLEGAETKADIILGLDTGTVAEARSTGLFTDHGVDTSALKLPTDWRSPDFVPVDFGYFAFVYNTEKVPNPPTSFEELASEDNDLQIAIQDPRSATPGLGLVLWIKAAYGDDAKEVWTDLKPKILTVTRGWSESYNLFLDGEADMVLSYTTSPAYHLIAEDQSNFAAAPFKEGHYTQIEVAGILKSSKQQDLARDFLTYMITPEAQAAIPTTNWMYPVADIALPEGFDTLTVPEKPLLMDDETVGTHTNAWIEEMLGALK
jgi:thiamine transport system substrate-binding protein